MRRPLLSLALTALLALAASSGRFAVLPPEAALADTNGTCLAVPSPLPTVDPNFFGPVFPACDPINRALSVKVISGGSSGDVSITNWPTLQPVTVTGPVSVTGNFPTPIPFPAIQPVSGTVAVSNQITPIPFPSVQSVSGTVMVSNFPTPVAFPSVQIVSVSNATAAYVVNSGPNVTAIAAGVSGPNIIKGAGTILYRAIVTASGLTGTATFYDNAATTSGRIVGVVPGTSIDSLAVAGRVYDFEMPTTNGITECSNALSPAVTVNYW